MVKERILRYIGGLLFCIVFWVIVIKIILN